ncbi:hypothetical protein H257_08086 [Aphanomyces astaci]|uniref:Elicitin-like protein n=1 Tax=Aphanomyces astaci TaxID=112090 RepID=W4GHU7_APHAT|nr:hypothetical protein H257_08086 [Aphanomyces astaci]ETV78589.1 hypothetical protein H257_08086 [Aphanomyces astaci]|eukprot:XP_009832170.1 hypothetical protein H257_08086 [Aphanomyces astaci]
MSVTLTTMHAHFTLAAAALTLIGAEAQPIGLRPPCERGLLLEMAGKGIWSRCADKTGLDINDVDKANEATLCSVPECVYVLHKAAVLTTCDDAALFAQLCTANATEPMPTTSRVTPTTNTILPTTSSTPTTQSTPSSTSTQVTSAPQVTSAGLSLVGVSLPAAIILTVACL